jgi:predicted nucleotide-binding protein
MQPGSGTFRALTGAAIAYGLIEGGGYSAEIKLTALASRIVRPLAEGDDLKAKREAFLRPRVVGEFLRKYNGSKFPRDDIAMNVLHDMGVPRDRAERALQIIKEGAEELGLLQKIKDTSYVHIDPSTADSQASADAGPVGEDDGANDRMNENEVAPKSTVVGPSQPAIQRADRTAVMRRVFLTHGKNRTFIDTLKRLLGIVELEAVVSVDRESPSIPVPQKIMKDMRTCGSAIIHVDDEERLVFPGDATERVVLNSNVLIEIGAAMALYGQRFILLVKDGVKLPSNLQGLYEVRYAGDAPDASTTIRLIEAIGEMKKQPLPFVWLEGQ